MGTSLRGVGGTSSGALEVTVIAFALLGTAEYGVGFGDLDEAVGGLWVVGVAVGVVGFG